MGLRARVRRAHARLGVRRRPRPHGAVLDAVGWRAVRAARRCGRRRRAPPEAASASRSPCRARRCTTSTAAAPTAAACRRAPCRRRRHRPTEYELRHRRAPGRRAPTAPRRSTLWRPPATPTAAHSSTRRGSAARAPTARAAQRLSWAWEGADAFDAAAFVERVSRLRGNASAGRVRDREVIFAGDSTARQQAASLCCLLRAGFVGSAETEVRLAITGGANGHGPFRCHVERRDGSGGGGRRKRRTLLTVSFERLGGVQHACRADATRGIVRELNPHINLFLGRAIARARRCSSSTSARGSTRMDAPTRTRATTASAAASGRGSIPTTSRAGGWSARRSRRRTRRRCARRRSSSRARRRRATLRRARGTRAARAPPPRPPTPPRSLPRSKPPRRRAAARRRRGQSRCASPRCRRCCWRRRRSPSVTCGCACSTLTKSRGSASRRTQASTARGHLGLPPPVPARRARRVQRRAAPLAAAAAATPTARPLRLARWRGAQYGGGAFVDGESTDALALRLSPGAPPTRLACLA